MNKKNKVYKIDIVTTESFIDCRTWVWDELSAEEIEELFVRAKYLRAYAQKEGKTYGFCFQNEAPQFVKDRFKELGVLIFEKSKRA